MWHLDLSRKLRFKSEPDLNPWPMESQCVCFYSSFNLGLASLLVCFLIQFWGPWSSILIIGIKLFIIFMAWRSGNFVFSWLYYVILLRNVWSFCLTMHLKKKKKSPMLQCWNSNRTISPIFPPTLKKKKKICSHGNAALS